MSLPKSLELAAEEALRTVHDHADHEYLPANRLQLELAFETLGTNAADSAYRWHAVLAAKYVLPLYQEPAYPESYYEKIKAFPPDEWKQLQERMRLDEPAVAIDIAEKVLRGEYDSVEANGIVNETGYYIGYYKRYQPIRAYFAEMASHVALSQATSSDTKRVGSFSRVRSWDDYNPTNLQWIWDGGADAVAYSFLAQCSVVDSSQATKNPERSEYDSWTNNPVISRSESLSFWQWWLTDALEEAWQRANVQSG